MHMTSTHSLKNRNLKVWIYKLAGIVFWKQDFNLYSLRLDTNEKWKLFHYLAYFCYYLWVSLHFLILFMGFTVLFQQTFTFIYSTFSNKFSVSAK